MKESQVFTVSISTIHKEHDFLSHIFSAAPQLPLCVQPSPLLSFLCLTGDPCMDAHLTLSDGPCWEALLAGWSLLPAWMLTSHIGLPLSCTLFFASLQLWYSPLSTSINFYLEADTLIRSSSLTVHGHSSNLLASYGYWWPDDVHG